MMTRAHLTGPNRDDRTGRLVGRTVSTTPEGIVREIGGAELGERFALEVFDGASTLLPQRVVECPHRLEVPFRTSNALLRAEARRVDAAGQPNVDCGATAR